MKTGWALPLLAVVLMVAGQVPQRRLLCPGFLPPNNMMIPVGQGKGIDEVSFNQVLDRAEAFYKPVFAARGATLVVNRLWSDPTVNASANQSGMKWHINMYGGLARHKAVTADGFALVVCHEIGHHIGGYPKKSWATNEGGADYYATLKCMRSLLNQTAVAAVDPLAKAGCAVSFPEGAERDLCESGTMAGISVSSLLAELGGRPQPSLATPDITVVTRTNDAHPAAQCRLDTYFQGAVCVKPVSEPLSETQPGPGACTTADGFQTGVRPLCWFKPPAPALLSPVAAKAIGQSLETLEQTLSGNGI